MIPVLSSKRITVSREELRISPVEREDKGMYQCFVYNDKESSQDAAQLVLGGNLNFYAIKNGASSLFNQIKALQKKISKNQSHEL